MIDRSCLSFALNKWKLHHLMGRCRGAIDAQNSYPIAVTTKDARKRFRRLVSFGLFFDCIPDQCTIRELVIIVEHIKTLVELGTLKCLLRRGQIYDQLLDYHTRLSESLALFQVRESFCEARRLLTSGNRCHPVREPLVSRMASNKPES